MTNDEKDLGLMMRANELVEKIHRLLPDTDLETWGFTLVALNTDWVMHHPSSARVAAWARLSSHVLELTADNESREGKGWNQ
jgi:hypothetical protein